MLAFEISTYFEELKNEIDIKCEEFLSIKITHEQKEYLNDQRRLFINKIDDCIRDCLDEFKIQKYQHFNVEKQNNFSTFKKFCFLIQPKNRQKICLGKLIVTNFFIPHKVQENIKFKYYNQLYNCVSLNSKELVIENFLYSLFETYLRKDENLIDLSCKENNILESFNLEFSLNDDFCSSDFNLLENVISKKCLSSCELRFHNQNLITQSILSVFENVTSMHIFLNHINNYDENLFENFKNLRRLTITDLNDNVLRKNLFTGLDSLKYLKIQSKSVKKFENFCFKNLENLEILTLDLESCFQIDRSDFYDLEKLQELSINISLVESIPNDIFALMSKLKSLRISAKSMSQINFLQKLDFHIEFIELVILNSNKVFYGDSSKFKHFFSKEKELENQIYNMIGMNGKRKVYVS